MQPWNYGIASESDLFQRLRIYEAHLLMEPMLLHVSYLILMKVSDRNELSVSKELLLSSTPQQFQQFMVSVVVCFEQLV
jgi:hypothetical protein